ncbi:hypothetical protein CXB49_10765 [Chromobacterium sp. ATCC 53434]|uniref:hypothetical protein n=1 Tax=Chromobacterium sp. (strain ATCC 53434 / SC 14030) TaxID=2059672 RepID=UPI000C7751B0|nr:hypothetical protein [Chromobacterium sp. ATCC 53434]AUH51257.1 hypothetical protein CXB49_10765 [Chromobacterium sp. ATCC 53434]
MMKIHHVGDHVVARRQRYPDTGEQLDVLWRVIASLPPDTLPPEAAAMLDQIRAVKNTYPKPRDSGASSLEA